MTSKNGRAQVMSLNKITQSKFFSAQYVVKFWNFLPQDTSMSQVLKSWLDNLIEENTIES